MNLRKSDVFRVLTVTLLTWFCVPSGTEASYINVVGQCTQTAVIEAGCPPEELALVLVYEQCGSGPEEFLAGASGTPIARLAVRNKSGCCYKIELFCNGTLTQTTFYCC